MVNLWKRSISITPTAGSTAANNSGRCVRQAPTNSPPLLPPEIANRWLLVYLFSISHSAAAMKSSNTFCFFSRMPAVCQARPYSPPPRKFGTA